MKRSVFAYPFAIFAIIFFLAPILLIAYYSIVTDGRLTFEYYLKFFDFSSPVYIHILAKSLELAVYCTFICLLLGFPMAYILSRMKQSVRNIVSLLFILPMWMNFLLRTYAWRSLLQNNGFLNYFLKMIGLPPLNIMYSNTAIVLVMVYNFLPFMILPIYNMLVKLDYNLIEAGEDLGASPSYSFRKIIIPLVIPGVLSGINMVFMPAVTTFVISSIIGGGKTKLIGDVIEYQYKYANEGFGFGSAMSVIIMVLVLLFMALLSGFEKTGDEGGITI